MTFELGDSFRGEDLNPKELEILLNKYSKMLLNEGYSPIPYSNLEDNLERVRFRGGKQDTTCHALWMCNEAMKFLRQGRFQKACRWVGTIQGILWMNGFYTILELKQHNRADF